MTEIKDNSIQCCVTSPPYWGLRKYDGEQDLIWGDSDCKHEWHTRDYLMHNGRGDAQKSGKYSTQEPISDMPTSDNHCSLCGAWKGAYGLEPTPEMYVEHTIQVMREIRRVLRKDGVLFWNIGDSYTPQSSHKGGTQYDKFKNTKNWDVRSDALSTRSNYGKPKDLCLIPFRVALAAQQDGWWVRSDIIWNKTNPMPESVKDRPTNAYEHILMLTKSARYYWDINAVREDNLPQSIERAKHAWKQHKTNNMVSIHGVDTDVMGNRFVPENGRNLRDVWTFPTQPYPEAHFATFPEALPERCIKAASKEGDTILDLFAGSGTTLWVAKKLGRKAVGYELSKKYCELIVNRNRQQVF